MRQRLLTLILLALILAPGVIGLRQISHHRGIYG